MELVEWDIFEYRQYGPYTECFHSIDIMMNFNYRFVRYTNNPVFILIKLKVKENDLISASYNFTHLSRKFMHLKLISDSVIKL